MVFLELPIDILGFKFSVYFGIALGILLSGLVYKLHGRVWSRGLQEIDMKANMSYLVDSIAALRVDSPPHPPQSAKPEKLLASEAMPKAVTKQPYDAFLVLDVEATCIEGGTCFEYPNEIIEWPVCLLRWKNKNSKGEADTLEIVDEFRSFVRPTWRPQLSDFCKRLTGITQGQVNSAPTFPQVMKTFEEFMIRNGLIDAETGRRLVRFCWCCDGPWDIRDFVVKQCFMSKMQMPAWIQGEMLNVRRVVSEGCTSTMRRQTPQNGRRNAGAFPLPKRISLTISQQLQVLDLPPFEGRQHSGIDDTRNITRIVIEIARRGMVLRPNTAINPNRRWPWMGKLGRMREEYY